MRLSWRGKEMSSVYEVEFKDVCKDVAWTRFVLAKDIGEALKRAKDEVSATSQIVVIHVQLMGMAL